ncbi:MAG: thiolase family protein [Desulfatibacillaceae bacterium]|nr:thiolase family protein [Desulfatibacillaceae bacterium]
MSRRVGICAVAQSTYEREKWYERFQGMCLEILEPLLEQTGLDFAEDTGINMTVSVSDDVFDARTISDNGMTDVLGGHLRCEEKIAQEGIQAVYYGLAAILSGHQDVVLIIGHCKESQGESRNQATHLAFDPFYTRPVGLDFLAAAGLQARAYQKAKGLTDDQMAQVVVRCREKAAKNPLTQDLAPITAQDVKNSPLLADPIRQLHTYPISDGSVGMILASEERAKKICKNPIWITGVGNCMDSFFMGDRDIASNFALKKAAQKAYKRAGIDNPNGAFDVIEVSDQYAYQQPMWMEGLGLADSGPDWLDRGGPDKDRVNLSGGMLAGNPLLLGGLVRAAEAATQLMGQAGERQVDGAKRALAHGVMGPAGQFHSVLILERD